MSTCALSPKALYCSKSVLCAFKYFIIFHLTCCWSVKQQPVTYIESPLSTPSGGEGVLFALCAYRMPITCVVHTGKNTLICLLCVISSGSECTIKMVRRCIKAAPVPPELWHRCFSIERGLELEMLSFTVFTLAGIKLPGSGSLFYS